MGMVRQYCALLPSARLLALGQGKMKIDRALTQMRRDVSERESEGEQPSEGASEQET